TLMNGGRGQHRIEGIGDKMCTLIHNVLNTDFIALIKDDDAVRGLKLIQDGNAVLKEAGVDSNTIKYMHNLFGVSGVCNILGAIKMAKYLKLGKDDNVVTVATDGFDRYDSVIKDLERRYLETEDFVLKRWLNDIFFNADTTHIADYRNHDMKEKLFKQKEKDWVKFDYDKTYLDAMREPAFWDREYAKVFDYNDAIKKKRDDTDA
ncbi:MAG: pyridoxal-5'-phosphate-dependent protein subunit beta, partial [Bacillota bacterium]